MAFFMGKFRMGSVQQLDIKNICDIISISIEILITMGGEQLLFKFVQI
jgi:hypothetical protein